MGRSKKAENLVCLKKPKDQFFTNSSIKELGDTIQRFHPSFDKDMFFHSMYEESWVGKELKEKMHHTTLCLHETLPESYQDALDILYKVAPHIKVFEDLCFPDYVELFGMDDWDLSLPALGYFTQFASAEFAMRPYLSKDPERTMAHIRISKHPKSRLSSHPGLDAGGFCHHVEYLDILPVYRS